ncbi:MAG: YccF domain-containing protein [Candidatus Improbicoccus devescovinae]|nr:MAG: YccF domain-containing protein [Candidatus Improbicoccus devescovinae]
MKIIANILWIIFGGFILSLMWFISGIVLCVTILGIPFGIQCFKFTALMLAPFGKEIIYSSKISSLLFNLIWILVFGWELAISSAIIGLIWCVTIIGLPIGLQCFKFSQLAFMPFGAEIVTKRKDKYTFKS